MDPEPTNAELKQRIDELEGEIRSRDRIARQSAENETKYRTILESLEEGYYETDLRGSFTFFNRATCRLHGCLPDELMGLNYRDFMPVRTAAEIYKIYNRIFRTGEPAEFITHEIIRNDGTVRMIEQSASLLRNGSGTPIGFHGISRDVTDKRRAERALQESEARYRNILQTMEEGYYQTDLAGNFTFFNKALVRIYGYPAQTLMGMNYRDYLKAAEAKRVRSICNRVYRTGNSAHIVDYEIITRKGESRIIEKSIALLRDPDGTVTGFHGITRDVTEKKKVAAQLTEYQEHLEELVQQRTRQLESAQKKLVKREKLAVLGQLTATVSHELRNPLGVIRSSNYYLQRKIGNKDPKLTKHFARIDEQVHHSDSIVAELLEFTRGRNISTTKAQLNPWLEALLEELTESVQVKLIKELAPGLPDLSFDHEKMRRVIVNLIDNALQAVDTRRRKAAGKAERYTPEIRIATRMQDNGVRLQIADNGIGMDLKTRKSAFEPLFTTRASGTGIGLANVRKIISEHGGTIHLKSDPGHGTTLQITLPVAEHIGGKDPKNRRARRTEDLLQ